MAYRSDIGLGPTSPSLKFRPADTSPRGHPRQARQGDNDTDGVLGARGGRDSHQQDRSVDCVDLVPGTWQQTAADEARGIALDAGHMKGRGQDAT